MASELLSSAYLALLLASPAAALEALDMGGIAPAWTTEASPMFFSFERL